MFSTSFETPIKEAPAKIYNRHNNSKGDGRGKAKNTSKGNHSGEHLGVFIAVKSWLKPYILDFKQLGPRFIYIRLATRSFELALISTLAPRSGRPDEERRQYYDTLSATIQDLPTNCRLLIAGDLNANLHHRFPLEQHIIGPYLIGNGEAYLLQKRRECQGTLNRDYLIEFCEKHSLVIANTWQQHPLNELFTYKKPTTPYFAPPWTTEHFSTLDFCLIQDRFLHQKHHRQARLILRLRPPNAYNRPGHQTHKTKSLPKTITDPPNCHTNTRTTCQLQQNPPS